MTEINVLTKRKKGGNIVAGVILFILTFLIMVTMIVYLAGALICSGKYPNAKRVFVTTVLETGAMKFAASLYLSQDEINEIVRANSMEEFNESVNEELITIGKSETVYIDKYNDVSAGAVTISQEAIVKEIQTDPDGDGIDVFEVAGRTFLGKMMVVYDPTRLSVEAKYPWGDVGKTLDWFVKQAGAVAGINGGLYKESGNTGGMPYGVVVSNGEILRNKPQEVRGLVLVGLSGKGILVVENVSALDEEGVIQLVQEKDIRNAVCFQEESNDKNNHFVQLIINGNAREMNGMGSGLNPRTAIGQRADGALLLLVTDGRGTSGHLGASASDLIEVMTEYGAVNAANLDGGSSSCMYYNDEYLMNSVTFYYANSSWNMPLALVIK